MKNRAIRRLFLLTLSLAVFGSAIGVAAQEREMGGVGITVFKDKDFRGTAATYTSDVMNLDGTGLNDQISSIRVGPGERWEICRDANYQGRCVVVSGEERDLKRNSWDNMISSMRRVGGGWNPPTQNDYIVLFTDINYRGEPSNYNGPSPYLNRRARSVTIGRGSWQFCEGTNYTGRCVTINQSVSNLATYNLSNRISSARPMGAVPPTPPPVEKPYIVLYTQPNYRGTPTNYNTAQSRITKSTGSITIGRGVWEVCSGFNYTGNCRTLNQSVPNNAIFGVVNRTIRSLRPIAPQPR